MLFVSNFFSAGLHVAERRIFLIITTSMNNINKTAIVHVAMAMVTTVPVSKPKVLF